MSTCSWGQATELHSDNLWAINHDGVAYRAISLVNVVALSHQELTTDDHQHKESKNKLQPPITTPIFHPCFLRIMPTQKSHAKSACWQNGIYPPKTSQSVSQSATHPNDAQMACIMYPWLVHAPTWGDPWFACNHYGLIYHRNINLSTLSHLRMGAWGGTGMHSVYDSYSLGLEHNFWGVGYPPH